MYASLDLIIFFNGSHSLWRPGQDNISFFQGHDLRNVADDVGDGKNHGRLSRKLIKKEQLTGSKEHGVSQVALVVKNLPASGKEPAHK